MFVKGWNLSDCKNNICTFAQSSVILFRLLVPLLEYLKKIARLFLYSGICKFPPSSPRVGKKG